MSAIEAQLREPAFRAWLIILEAPAFVRPDGFFDVAAHERWLEARYREWRQRGVL